MHVDTILAGIAILLLAVSVLIQLSITALRSIAPHVSTLTHPGAPGDERHVV
jgi:hypothetical protein